MFFDTGVCACVFLDAGVVACVVKAGEKHSFFGGSCFRSLTVLPTAKASRIGVSNIKTDRRYINLVPSIFEKMGNNYH